MTNYNDGKWHGWNGGECPVHPKTAVEAISADGIPTHEDFDPSLIRREAETIDWGRTAGDLRAPVVAFRVIKEHREPREWWVNEYHDGVLVINSSKDEADGSAGLGRLRCIHVREVLE